MATRAALTLCAIALWLAALAPSALAAPTHPRTPALDVEGLNRACGTAVDSEGNVYASSAGEGKVKVFGPSDHATPIAEIANANEPCALAVDSKGTLLVSEQATGNVVAYGPGAYPFSGPPAYGPPVTVDASGDAVGIALDRTDDRLYVAEGDHVAVYSSEIQQVGIFEATGGTYKLKFKGEETSSLPFDATAAEVKAALEALGTIGAGEVSVSSGKRVTFARGLGYTDVPQLEDVSSLQGNEIQKVTVKATTGTYKLKFEGEETGSIAFNAKASEPGGPVDSVQEALEALASIAPGDVTVAGGPGDATGTKPYLVTFKGAYAAANVGTMSSSASLGGGSAAVASASQFQRITVAATGGTYTLKFPNVGGQETAPIAFNATAAEVQAALEALSNIAPGDVTVSGGPGDAEGTRPYLVHFEGAYAASDIAQMGRSNTGLTGTASISRILDGASHGTSTPASGGLGAGETQEVKVANALSGTYKLKFEGEETAAIPFNATAAEVQAALEALAKIATGDVAVFPNGTPTFASRNYAAGFGGAYAATDVPQLTAVSSLGPGGAAVTASTTAAGWSGQALKGQLTEATGVAPYTNTSAQANPRLNLAVADGAGDEVEIFSGSGPATLKSRKAITGIDHDEDPGTAEREFSFGAAGAYLAVDPGNEDAPTQGCAQVQVGGKDQACTQGHFFLHDAGNDAIYEFDATGELFAQVTAAGLSADAGPTQVAVERSGGANDGTLYAGSGSGAAAKLLAFAPVLKPSRTPLGEPFSKVLTGAVAVATDCNGYVYVAAQSSVRVYSPAGAEVTSFAEANAPSDLAVDCAGNVYVVDTIAPTPQMTYYSPSSPSPPSGATTYARHEPSLVTAAGLQGVAVNPANGHVFVLGSQLFGQVIREFGPPSGGSKAEGECGAGLDVTTLRLDIDVYGKTGNVYVSGNSEFVYVLKCGKEPKDAELIREIKGGGGCSSGKWGSNPGIAVDQSNGHFIEYSIGQPGAAAREYDAVGACLAEFGTFSSSSGSYRLAIDNSCALHGLTEETTPTCEDTYPSSGNAYVAWDGPDNNVQPYDVTAFEPLGYGVRPQAVTGTADGFGPGGATLHGTVDPEEFELEECAFQYLADSEYEKNLVKIEEELIEDPFEGALSQACEETPAEIGNGGKPVPVHAGITGIDPETTRYRYRLHTRNPFDEDDGDALLFGPPLLMTQSALPVAYDEATMRAKVNPSGLLTTYRFEYLTEEEYKANGETFEGALITPEGEIPPGEDGDVAIEAPVTGLAQGTAYRFRVLVENAVKAVEGPPQAFETIVRPPPQNCANSEYRTGLSAFLPDCRAYELVTPAQTLSLSGTFSATAGFRFFNSWFVAPRGAGAGESVAYRANVARVDGEFFRAQRGPGTHPATGWESEQYGFTFVQGGGGEGEQGGVSADQRYMLHEVLSHSTPTELNFPVATYMRVPSGQASRDCAPEPKATFELSDPDREFELVGCGALGIDLQADGRFVSAGGAHVIFTSKEALEGNSPPKGTVAIYDREAGKATAEIVSLKPDGTPFGAGEALRYLATTEDGEAVVFSAAGTLYVRRSGKTTVLAEGSTYAGISTDGKRVFFIDDTYSPTVENPMIAAGLSACEIEGGNCAGPEQAQEPLEIAPNSVFVNISADGSHVFFMSEDALTEPGEKNEKGEKAEDGESNLYAWDGADTSFVALLHPQDLISFSKGEGNEEFDEDLLQWTNAIPGQRATSGSAYEVGRAYSPVRSTPDGEVLVFQSHAQLTAYDNEGRGEIYRYVPAAAPGPQLSCVSCSPSGAPHASPADVLLQTVNSEATNPSTLIPNVTDDGSTVFFESRDALLPEDANAGVDVYEWKAQGKTGPGGDTCGRPAGCLALVSTGQGEESSHLFGMSADGEDVFFVTREELVGTDISGSFSLYDARVLGGIPPPPDNGECEADACQGQGSIPPVLPAPASTGPGAATPPQVRPRCPKGKHRVKGRCVKKKSSKRKGHRKRSKQHQEAR